MCSARSQRRPPTPSGFSGSRPWSRTIAQAQSPRTAWVHRIAPPYARQPIGAAESMPNAAYASRSTGPKSRSRTVGRPESAASMYAPSGTIAASRTARVATTTPIRTPPVGPSRRRGRRRRPRPRAAGTGPRGLRGSVSFRCRRGRRSSRRHRARRTQRRAPPGPGARPRASAVPSESRVAPKPGTTVRAALPPSSESVGSSSTYTEYRSPNRSSGATRATSVPAEAPSADRTGLQPRFATIANRVQVWLAWSSGAAVTPSVPGFQ